LSGTRVTQSRGEKGAQNTTAVHWKCGQQVEEDEYHIDREQLNEEIRTGGSMFEGKSTPANEYEQGQRDHHVHERTSQRDDEFLPRFIGHSLQTGDAANRQKGNVRSIDPIVFCCDGVTKLVQDHTDEQQEHKNHAPKRDGRAALCVITERQPSD
jgi:hypothetical protein